MKRALCRREAEAGTGDVVVTATEGAAIGPNLKKREKNIWSNNKVMWRKPTESRQQFHVEAEVGIDETIAGEAEDEVVTAIFKMKVKSTLLRLRMHIPQVNQLLSNFCTL